MEHEEETQTATSGVPEHESSQTLPAAIPEDSIWDENNVLIDPEKDAEAKAAADLVLRDKVELQNEQIAAAAQAEDAEAGQGGDNALDATPALGIPTHLPNASPTVPDEDDEDDENFHI